MAFILEPEVAGSWGEGIEADTSVHPPVVKKLNYEFQGWLGDELLESFPCFIVSQKLAQLIASSSLTDYSLAPVKVTKSEQFAELHPGLELPAFQWLQVDGEVGIDDFAFNSQHLLEVSEAAFKVISRASISHCGVVKR